MAPIALSAFKDSTSTALTESWAEQLRAVTAERDMLKREWDAVTKALGPHASPGLTPSQNVAYLVAARMGQIAETAEELRVRVRDGAGVRATDDRQSMTDEDYETTMPVFSAWRQVDEHAWQRSYALWSASVGRISTGWYWLLENGARGQRGYHEADAAMRACDAYMEKHCGAILGRLQRERDGLAQWKEDGDG
jgi:hypothetical protein